MSIVGNSVLTYSELFQKPAVPPREKRGALGVVAVPETARRTWRAQTISEPG
jgi:hypothetical protein